MSQSEIWDTLQIARDARQCGLAAQFVLLMDEIAPDFEYMRRSHRKAIHRFWFDDGTDEYDDPYEVESEAEQRARWRADVGKIAWLAWINPLKSGDTIECRVASYANLIQPVAYGVFTIPGDD